MAEKGSIRSRPLGATATVGRTGYPAIRSRTGGTLQIATGASEPGFNPIDLLYASLSACMAMSARIAANRLGVMANIRSIAVEVAGDKHEPEPSRVEKLSLTLHVEGDVDEEMKVRILEIAEEICTVSNTLKTPPRMEAALAAPGDAD